MFSVPTSCRDHLRRLTAAVGVTVGATIGATVAVIGMVGLLSNAGSAMAQDVVKVATVANVDLQRYAGKWYEIARFPNSFQKQCVSSVSAEYQARADGDITVVNRCKVEGNTEEQAAGLARIVPGSNNAKLQVRFAPAWLSWLPLVWGDYWIIDLDPDYAVVTIGTPSRDYLWILSRTPSLSAVQYEAAVNNATRQGFDTARLVKTPQP